VLREINSQRKTMKWMEHRAKLVANLSENLVDRWIGQSFDTHQFITKIKQKRRKGKRYFMSENSRFRNREVPADSAKTTAIELIQESDMLERAGQATQEMKFRRCKRNQCPAAWQTI